MRGWTWDWDSVDNVHGKSAIQQVIRPPFWHKGPYKATSFMINCLSLSSYIRVTLSV